MNNARLAERERAMSALARDVLQSLPTEESWPAQKVHRELANEGKNIERRVLDGCLSSLARTKLVIEAPYGHWRRVPPKAYTVDDAAREYAELEPVTIAEPKPPVELKPIIEDDPLDSFAEIASTLRQIALLLDTVSTAAESLRRTTERLEACALDAEERALANDDSKEQLRKLREQLKGISNG